MMPFDTLMMMAVTGEMRSAATGALVQRVHEPRRGELALSLYGPGSRPCLLFSIDPRHARAHLTGQRLPGGGQPSSFCMLLRKYLVGARPAHFSNPPLERVLEITFQPPAGLPPVRLVVEIMGRRSNLILVGEKGLVLGAARPVSAERNPRRPIEPGRPYRPAPPLDRLNPLTVSPAQLSKALAGGVAGGLDLLETLVSSVGGLSPLTAREVIYRSGGGVEPDPENLCRVLRELFEAAAGGGLQPVLLPGKKIFSAIPLHHLAAEEQIFYDKPGAMLDRYYGSLLEEERAAALSDTLRRAALKRLAALDRKRQQQEKELEAAGEAHLYRLYGELLLTYGSRVERGAEQVNLPDHYRPGESVTVPLDPAVSPGSNAERYFKRYRKAKKGAGQIRRQLERTGAEAEYCRSLLYSIESSPVNLLEEISREMAEGGYLKKVRKGKSHREQEPQPAVFQTSSGRRILVGRNNRQNDHVVFRAAVRRDTWFHARGIPGGHVVLKEAPDPPPADDIAEAAFLAAYFSRGRDSRAVEVDFTAVRHVRRRPGGRPGLVFYDNYRTITVNPGDNRLKQLFGLQ